jgi:diguanylate cyclase (GGDEF)-like protein
MPVPRTYRLRLVTYIAVLLGFLVGVLVLAYRASSELVVREAQTNLDRIVQQLGGQIRIESADLLERAKMVRDNASFQEYLFIVTTLDTGSEALREQHGRQFAWLQIDRAVVVARDGRTLLGGEHRDLIDALKVRDLAKATREDLVYLDDHGALEMVAIAPIYFRSQHLGLVAVTKTLGAQWMSTVRQMTGGELLLVKNDKIIASTLGTASGAGELAAQADRLTIGDEHFLVKRIALGDGVQVCELWFALSQAELTARLSEQRNVVLGLAIAGCVAILLVGLLLLRNFSAPLGRLIADIRAVREGRFPELRETHARDEMGYLASQFSAMVKSLRDKQEEINLVHAQLEEQATTDALTGCYNRRYLYDIYPKLWSEALRQDKRVAVLLIDLDLFKRINDQHGHLAGDEVLRHFAEVLRSCTRMSDFLCRLGGEEFLVLTQGDSEGAQILAEKIRATTASSPVPHDGHSIRVTVSIGVAQADPRDGLKGLSAVLVRADHALYAAKEAGRDRVAVYEERYRRRA